MNKLGLVNFSSFLVPAVTVILLPGCEKKISQDELLHHVTKGEIINAIEYQGSVRSANRVEAPIPTGATIRRLLSENGTFVNKGAPLAEIEDASLDEGIRSTETELSKLAGEIKAKEIKFKDTQNTYKAQQTLFKKGVISGRELSDSKREFQLANNALNTAKKELESKTKDKSDLVEKKTGQIVVAPKSGTLEILYETERKINPAKIFIADSKHLEIEFFLNEVDVVKVNQNHQVGVSFDALPGVNFDGSIARISDQPFSTSGGANGKLVTYQGIIKLSNIDERLRIGMTALIKIILESSQDTLVVPRAAVQYSNEKPYVILVDKENKKHQTFVSLGIVSYGAVEIVSGLNADDIIEIPMVGK